MGLWLVLGLVVASAPDAGEAAVSEPLAAVASCALPSWLHNPGEAAARFVEVKGHRVVQLDEELGPSGAGAHVMRRLWLVVPETCRTVALQLDYVGGHPSVGAMVIHRPGQPATELERAVLLSWLGGEKLDARRPEHQAARTPAPRLLPPQPEVAPPPEDAEEEASQEEAEAPARTRARRKAPASFIVRALKQPPPVWVPGPPVPQALTWTESSLFAEQERPSVGVPEGFVYSGRFYDVHRGDCCVREDTDKVRPVGSARLRYFSSPSRPTDKVTYLVLEQPRRSRSAWLVASGSQIGLLGVHAGRAWMFVPVHMDPGFSLMAIDLDSGASWHLDLARTPTFNPEDYAVRAPTREGLPLERFEEEEGTPGPGGPRRMTVPWAVLERALREAKPPAK